MIKDYNTVPGGTPVVYASAVPVNNVGYPQQAPSSYPASAGQPINPQVYQTQNLLPDKFNEGGAREFLLEQKWPKGLQDTFVKNLDKIAFRYFICDDSGSMSMNDGTVAVGGPGDLQKRLVNCSRWAELVSTLKFHMLLTRATCAPSEFCLLNAGSPVVIGMSDHADSDRFTHLTNLLEGGPSGGTPLCRHINRVVREIQGQESQLRAKGQKALVVIATDGEASDGNVAEAMRPFKNLPVWVMVRFCTGEDRIIDYWNKIDTELELSMDVVDDLCGEAKEIREHNPWLTYGEPLQRLREFGLSVKELDLLDERKLSLEEVRKVCSLIYGGTPDNFPHPEVDWKGFIAAIDHENTKLGKVWNPATTMPREWIHTATLSKCYKKSSVCTIM